VMRAGVEPPAAPEPQQGDRRPLFGEIVSYQVRKPKYGPDAPWGYCSKSVYENRSLGDEYEYRTLHALPQTDTPRSGDARLTFDAFRKANVARCVKWHPDGIASWSPSDWMTAVTGELGELASLLKMRNRERDGLAGNKFSPTQKQIADELADVLTYLDLLAEVLGVDLGAAAVEKFNEVSERVGFPDRIVLNPPADARDGDNAKRYRFVRKLYWFAQNVSFRFGVPEPKTLEELDGAIDRAMGGE
jgi:NTP pyrophosphatase (non-canonical NTP hydrolase)